MDTGILLECLCSINALTGFENEASGEIKKLMQPYCDKVWVDSFYNVVGYKKGFSDKPKKIMITAHYDQIGMIVSGYEENGFLRVSNLGGIDTRALLACEVTVHGREDVYGVIGAKPPHLLTEKELIKNVKIMELLIDTGYSDDIVKEKVAVGDPVSILSSAILMKNGCMSGRSMDNRCGVAAMIMILERLQRVKHENDIYAVATVQEEVHLIGAVTSSYSIEPDIALVIDVCHGDMPEADKAQTFQLGEGTPVSVGPAFHRKETDNLLKVAKMERIPTKLSIEPGDPGTEAWAIQVSRLGVPTLEVSIPVRYMHTGAELVLLKDIEMAAALIAAYSAGKKDLEEYGPEGDTL